MVVLVVRGNRRLRRGEKAAGQSQYNSEVRGTKPFLVWRNTGWRDMGSLLTKCLQSGVPVAGSWGTASGILLRQTPLVSGFRGPQPVEDVRVDAVWRSGWFHDKNRCS